jgi:hypothetical protein
MSLSPFVSFQSRFVTYLLNCSRKKRPLYRYICTKKLKIAVLSEVARCNLVAAYRDTFCLHFLCRTHKQYLSRTLATKGKAIPYKLGQAPVWVPEGGGSLDIYTIGT